MRKNALWAAVGLNSLLVIGVAWASQAPDEIPPITELTQAPDPGVGALPETISDEFAPEPTPEPALTLDPVEQVNQLSEQIRGRRASDQAEVTALVEQLTARAEEQRAALARTEEALGTAQALWAELVGQATVDAAEASLITAPAESSPFELDDRPPAAPDEPRSEAAPPALELPAPTPTAEIVSLSDAGEPPLIDDGGDRIGDLERRVERLIRELEEARRP